MSPTVDIGYFALCLALGAGIYAVLACGLGGYARSDALVRSGESAARALFGLLTISVACLWHLLLIGDFQVAYVAENTNRALPPPYVIAALWGGQNGSILFWSWLLALNTVVIVISNRHRFRSLMPYTVAVLTATSCFFAVMNLFAADPFQRLPFAPADGHGLNPILQHPLMAIHPPMLYAGMVGLSVPYAIAVSALLSRQLDSTWLRMARRWLLVPWMILGVGLLLGGKWAYVELGWGGYWAWDPVENASLMPWLAATALVHSIMIQERKGMLKAWNMILVFLTYGMTIFGTALTRSGVIESVHSFARSQVGPFFGVYLSIFVLFSALLLWDRRRDLRAESKLEAFASRETAFLLNNWILLGMLFAVLWGTLFPVISEAFTGEKITVSAPFFNQVNVPIGLVLLLLTGAGPLFAWRRTSTESLKQNFKVPVVAMILAGLVLAGIGVTDLYALVSLSLCVFVASAMGLEFHRGATARQRTAGDSYLVGLYRLLVKNRRRYGGYLVHIAMIMLFVGFTGKAFTVEREVVLHYGESTQIGRYGITYESLAVGEDANKTVTAAALTLKEDGRFLKTLLPERHFYKASEQGTTEVSIHATPREDFYVVLVGAADDNSAKFQIYINPLINWVWAGCLFFLLGTLWCLWPSTRERRLVEEDRARNRQADAFGLLPDIGLPTGTRPSA